MSLLTELNLFLHFDSTKMPRLRRLVWDSDMPSFQNGKSYFISLPGDRRRILLRRQFILFLLQTFRAHAVGRARGKFGVEVFFHRQPLVIVTHLAAPTTDAQKFLEMVQPFEQPPGDEMNPAPNQQNDNGAENGAAPVGSEWLVKNQVREVECFRQPRKNNHHGKAQGFRPENGVRFSLCLFHGFNFARDKNACPEKVTNLDGELFNG